MVMMAVLRIMGKWSVADRKASGSVISKLLFCVNHGKMGQSRCSIVVTVIQNKIECAPPGKFKGTSSLK
jgi:hypothetical protein